MSRLPQQSSRSPARTVAQVLAVALAIGVVAWLAVRAQRDAARDAAVGSQDELADPIDLPPTLPSSKSMILEPDDAVPGPPLKPRTLIFSSKSGRPLPSGTPLPSGDGSEPKPAPAATVLPSSKSLVIEPSNAKPAPQPAATGGGRQQQR